MKRSDSIKEIATALMGFNSEVSKIAKDAANPFFKNNYATLDHIIEEIRPILTKHGLTIMQFPSSDGTIVSVTTYLLHTSGEFLESEPLNMKPVKADPQGIGSCISYARRYSLQSFLSLNTGSEDDDGNAATHGNNKPTSNKQSQQQKPTGQQTPPTGQNVASDAQIKKINAMITKAIEKLQTKRENIIKALQKKEGIGAFDSLTNITKGQASRIISELEKQVGGTGE